MKEQITFSTFTDRFNAIRPNNFSYDGLRALYGYLEDLEEETEQEIELDVIALCCDYSEYQNLEEYLKDYDTEIGLFNKNSLTDEEKSLLEEEISNKTILIKLGDDLDDGFIIQVY